MSVTATGNKMLVRACAVASERCFDTLSGRFPAFPDYLAEKRLFIDWELITRGRPPTSPRFSFLKGEACFDVGAIL